MDIADALQIVIQLARQNIPDDHELKDVIQLAREKIPSEHELKDLAEKYIEACNMVEDLAVNYFGDD